MTSGRGPLGTDQSAAARLGSPSAHVPAVRAALERADGAATVLELAHASGVRSDHVAAALDLMVTGGAVIATDGAFELA